MPLALLFPRLARAARAVLAPARVGRSRWSCSPPRPAATLPPIGACIRSLWPSMLPAHGLRETAYALEAWLQELSFVLGPVLVGGIAALRLRSGRDAGRRRARASSAPSGSRSRRRCRPCSGHPGTGRARASARSARAGVRTVILACAGARLRVRRRRGDDAGVRRDARDARAGRLRARLLRCGSLIGGIWSGTRPAPRATRAALRLMLAALGVGCSCRRCSRRRSPSCAR